MVIKFNIKTLEKALASIGFTDLKKITSNKIVVYTAKNRVSVLQTIEKNIKNSVYDKTPGWYSSIGRILVENFTVLVKPIGGGGLSSRGMKNEDVLVKAINKYAKKGPINVVFVARNKKYKIVGCVSATRVGADTTGRKKADIILINKRGKKFRLSVKKDGAEMWESADSYYSKKVVAIIKKAVAEKKTKLIKHGGYYTIEPNIATPANTKEKKDVVFGSDILPGGAIITKTFSPGSITSNGNCVTVECSHIITKIKDVRGDKDVFFLIRNDKTRRGVVPYPGIRVLAVYRKRILRRLPVIK